MNDGSSIKTDCNEIITLLFETYDSPLHTLAFTLLRLPPLRFGVHQFVSEKIPVQMKTTIDPPAASING